MELERWAERNDALIGRKVAFAAGLSKGTLRTRVRRGRYTLVRRGVYGINGAVPTWRQAVRAVILAHGGGVVASHDTALQLLGVPLPRPAESIHVLGTVNTRCRMPGVTSHRSATLEAGDRTTRMGIPCTSPIRTVIDKSGTMSVKELGDVVDDLLRRGLLRLESLRRRVDRTLPAPGRSVARLRKVLAARIPGYDPGETPLETRILVALHKHGVPLPTQQHKVRLGGAKYRLDFAWPDRRVYLEGNGFGAHSITSDLDSDARRQNNMVIDGWLPIEITWRMSDSEIADTVRAILAR